jgi:hypothetical protein
MEVAKAPSPSKARAERDGPAMTANSTKKMPIALEVRNIIA